MTNGVRAVTAAILVSIVLAFVPAGADEVMIAGFTNGCFGAACTPGTSFAPSTVSLLGLTFNNSTFNGTTASGFLAIGNSPGTPNVDNLGSFTLNGTPATYTGQSFTERVTFTGPPGITGGNTRTFSATLTGSVASADVGGVFIDFNNTPTTFTFSFVNALGQTTTGSFNFAINDLSVIAGGTNAVSGTITAAGQSSLPGGAVPEPATLILMASGAIVAGVRHIMRRHRRR